MSSPSRIAALIVLGVLALALVGCGDTVIDDAKTEDAVQADLESSFHAKITAVECASDQKVEAGRTFTCAVEYTNGDRATATLKIRTTMPMSASSDSKPNK